MVTSSKVDRGTQKVRRAMMGGARAPGHQWQAERRRVRRADCRRLKRGEDDATLSGVGGLVAFNAFVQRAGLRHELREQFGHLKPGKGVVYPMAAQMQLLVDAAVVGAHRPFDVEALALDPVFVHIAGGAVPSVDVLYDDLRRFDEDERAKLAEFVAAQGLALLGAKPPARLTLDLDTTVETVFGDQEGAAVGYNPRYKGRKSYHPILARIAETGAIVGAQLRPGDTTLGVDDVEEVIRCVARVRAAAPDSDLTVRIDSAGDCGPILEAIHELKAFFIAKLKQTPDLLGAAMVHEHWTTVDRDAFGRSTRDVAVLEFQRQGWPPDTFRVIAVRDNDRRSGRQVCLWKGLDHSVQFFVTNDVAHDPDDIALRYDDRAGIEPLIGELKRDYGIGKIPTADFAANEVALLLELLAYNLVMLWRAHDAPAPAEWRTEWVRRHCLCIPARLLRAQGRLVLRLAPRRWLN
jgi:hypothetical protein